MLATFALGFITDDKYKDPDHICGSFVALSGDCAFRKNNYVKQVIKQPTISYSISLLNNILQSLTLYLVHHSDL